MTHSVAIQPHCRALAAGLLGLLILLISSNASSKDFYKWQDDDGITHYSAHPPRNQRPTEKVRATNTTGSPAGVKKPASRDEDKTEVAAEQATPSKKNGESCAIAQKNLKTLQENARVRIKEGDSFRYLSPVEKQEMEKSNREKIKEAC